jgi:WD40 repeat protein
VLILQGPGARARRLAFSPDGNLLASVAEEAHEVWLWDAVSGQSRGCLAAHQHPVTCLAFDPAEGLLASGDRWGRVCLWEPASGRLRSDWPLMRDLLVCLTFSPDGQHLALGSGAIRLLATTAGQAAGLLASLFSLASGDQVIYSMAFSGDGRTLVAGTEGGAVVWDLAARRQRARLRKMWPARVVAFGPGGTLALAACGGAVLWDLSSGETRAAVEGQEGMVTGMAFGPGGRVLATAAWQGAVRLWDVVSGRLLTSYDWGIGTVQAVAFSPDGMRLAAGGDRGLVIWDADF